MNNAKSKPTTVCSLCLGVMWIVDPHMSKHGTGGPNWACCITVHSGQLIGGTMTGSALRWRL